MHNTRIYIKYCSTRFCQKSYGINIGPKSLSIVILVLSFCTIASVAVADDADNDNSILRQAFIEMVFGSAGSSNKVDVIQKWQSPINIHYFSTQKLTRLNKDLLRHKQLMEIHAGLKFFLPPRKNVDRQNNKIVIFEGSSEQLEALSDVFLEKVGPRRILFQDKIKSALTKTGCFKYLFRDKPFLYLGYILSEVNRRYEDRKYCIIRGLFEAMGVHTFPRGGGQEPTKTPTDPTIYSKSDLVILGALYDRRMLAGIDVQAATKIFDQIQQIGGSNGTQIDQK